MSSGHATLVHFADGTVKWATYSGTSDVLTPRLWDTLDEASAGRSEGWCVTCGARCEPELVIVWTTYGGGFGWEARACRHQVIGPLSPYYEEDGLGRTIQEASEEIKIEPEWVRAAWSRS